MYIVTLVEDFDMWAIKQTIRPCRSALWASRTKWCSYKTSCVMRNIHLSSRFSQWQCSKFFRRCLLYKLWSMIQSSIHHTFTGNTIGVENSILYTSSCTSVWCQLLSSFCSGWDPRMGKRNLWKRWKWDSRASSWRCWRKKSDFKLTKVYIYTFVSDFKLTKVYIFDRQRGDDQHVSPTKYSAGRSLSPLHVC